MSSVSLISGFKTEKGSEYSIYQGGKTEIIFKANSAEKGNSYKGRVSDRTYYISYSDKKKYESFVKTHSKHPVSVSYSENKIQSLITLRAFPKEKNGEILATETLNIRGEPTPQIGKHPCELFPRGVMHVGHKIIALKHTKK